MKKILKLGATLALVGSILAPSAARANVTTLDDSVMAYQEAAPQLFEQTALESSVEITEDATTKSVEVEDNRTATSADNVSISFKKNGQSVSEGAGITSIDDESLSSTQLIQPLSEGFRIIRVLENAKAPDSFTYTLNVPEGAALEPIFGTIRVVRGDEIFGALKTPWAIDANGKAIPTRYTVEGKYVTQHIEINNETAFPVVADPAWGYMASYSLNYSPYTNWMRMHNCFKCYFPVTGAPQNWPSYGELLPLWTDLGNNMECKMSSTWVTGTSKFAWQFNATKNHFDGLGSTIYFEFSTSSTGKHRLIVDAFIVNDYLILNAVNESLAKNKWQDFANRLNK